MPCQATTSSGEWSISARQSRPRNFDDHFEGAFAIFIGGDGREEVAGVGQAVGADRAEVGQAERLAVVLADVAAGLAVGQLDAELDAARNDGQFARRNFENAELRAQQQLALLRQDQHFAVGVVEEAVVHRSVGDIEMDADAVLHGRVAVAAEGDNALDKVRRLRREAGADSSASGWAAWALRVKGPLRRRVVVANSA